jgi:hypothetical protein
MNIFIFMYSIVLLNCILQFCIPYSELYRCEGAVTPDMRIKRPEVRKEGVGGGGGVTLELVAKWGERHKIINN